MNKSHLSFENIDAYHQSFPKDIQKILSQLRSAIHSAVPNLTEVISYGMPAFKTSKVLVYYAVCKNHIGFYPTPNPIIHFKAALSGYTTTKGAIQFPIDQALPLQLIKQIVKFRQAETIETIHPKSRAVWHNWLVKNHQQKQSIWLIYDKRQSNKSSLTYTEAVEEAICFGWIDSKTKSINEHSYMQFFCKRKPNSVWSKVNKGKVEQLIASGLMQPAGFKSIQIAKENGSWNTLDEAEALTIPVQLETAFKNNENARLFFNGLSRTDQRNILQWLTLAKKNETREKRINDIIFNALQKEKPKPFR